jgi:hypothetical protein
MMATSKCRDFRETVLDVVRKAVALTAVTGLVPRRYRVNGQ